jgi:single-stranded DNA-binding protein
MLIGRISEYGLTVKPLAESGAMQGTFTLVVEELGTEGRVFSTWIVCEVYGRALAQAEQLEPGSLVCVDGKLKRRQRHTKQGEQFYDTVVLAWSVTTLVPTLHGASLATEA